MSNEETPTTEQPRALALAMRAGGRKKAAPKKAGRKAAPKKKAAAKKKNGRKKAAYGKKAAPKKAGSQGRAEEEGRREEGRRSEEGRGPQEGRRTQEGCCCRSSGSGLDAVGRLRFHELKTADPGSRSWSRAGCKGRHRGALFLCAGLTRRYPNVVSRSSTCRGVSSRGAVPRNSR